MAQEPGLTPEKQLLNLIENGQKAETGTGTGVPGAPAAAQTKTAARSGRFSLGALRGAVLGRFSFFKRTTTKKISKSKIRLSLGLANKFLAAAAVVLFFYVASDVTFSMMELGKAPNLLFQDGKAQTPSAAGQVSPLRDQAYYSQKISSRDIFKGEAEKREKKKEAAAPLADAGEKFKNLSLVGISWSSNPDAIIEDKDRQKTFFVKRGQMVGADIKVESILKDRVILSFDGEEFELK